MAQEEKQQLGQHLKDQGWIDEEYMVARHG
jgi:hypothetical protein